MYYLIVITTAVFAEASQQLNEIEQNLMYAQKEKVKELAYHVHKLTKTSPNFLGTNSIPLECK